MVSLLDLVVQGLFSATGDLDESDVLSKTRLQNFSTLDVSRITFEIDVEVSRKYIWKPKG